MTTSTTEIGAGDAPLTTDIAALQRLPELNARTDPAQLRYTCNTRVSVQN
ncbi:hypothetical protein ACQP1G_29350 [Nocardia sp. CA-107356]